MQELLMTAGRATVIYVVLLVVLRLLGKRTVGTSTAFDFMVALILGEVVDEPIYGHVPMVQALLVIGVIAGWHAINSWLSYRSPRFDHLTGGGPIVLVRGGAIDRQAMAHERVNDEDLWSLLRQQGVDDLKDVERATLEPDGRLSVILTSAAKSVARRDLPRVLRRAS
ncbi:MAG: DUF421 domain-containing protein [Candidatus Rokuibacteriota bacterium]